MFQTCFRRIHAFLVVTRYQDWLEGRHIDDEFRALNTLWVRFTQLSRKKNATNCSHHKLHTVKILNLTTDTWNITLAVHGYIDIASEGALWGEKYEYFFDEKTMKRAFSMFPSLDPIACKIDWRDRTYAPASSGELQP